MSVALTVDTSGFTLALQKFVTLTGADAEKTALRASRTFMRNVIAITPPGDGKQASDRAALTKEDQRRAQASVRADMAHLFVPVRLKGKRPEEWPDVAGLHRQAFITGKTPGKRIKRVGPAKYVDQRKYKARLAELLTHIGRLAAHWLAGLAEVGGLSAAPAWVKRHGPRGYGKKTPPGAPVFRFEAANPLVPTPIAAELDRRLVYAARYTAAGLDRQLAAILQKRAAEFSGGRRAA